MNLGVPVICAACNEERQKDINALPQLFADNETPLIIVDAAENDGSHVSGSQGEPQLTIYAPGGQYPMQSNIDSLHFVAGDTSLATPHVAGLLATCLSYDQKPWDDSKTGMDRVMEIKRFITTRETSWERKPGINVIWNGATEEDHKSVGAYSQKTRALSIIYQQSDTLADVTSGPRSSAYEWLFFATYKSASPICAEPGKLMPKYEVKAPGKFGQDAPPPWPAGTFKIDDVHGMQCEYKNDGKNNAGVLWSSGMHQFSLHVRQ